MKTIYSTFLLFMLFVLQTATAQTLKLYFPFTGNTNDASGNNINPTYTGAGLAPATDRFGQSSAAYGFDGASGSYLRVPADQLPTGDRTVSLWFRASDVSSRPVLLSYGGNSVSAPGSSYFMGLNLGGSSTYQVSGHFGSNNMEHAYSTAPVDQWIHWVVTIEGSSQKSFINGQLVATGSFNFPTFVTGKDLALGVATSTTGIAPYSDINVGYFQGSLDDVRIYEGALSDIQVQTLYNEESTPPAMDTYYVNDNSTTGDVFATSVGNDTNPGTASAPFATIQHAVNVAPAGSTIYVDAGIYVEQVTINKGLTLTGAGRTKTLVTLPATTAPVPGAFDEQATFQTLPDIADVHINDFSITGKYIAGAEAITPVILQTGGSVRNSNLQGGNQGIFFRTESVVKTALVENCIVDAEFVGVNFSGSNLTGTMLNNEVTVHNANFSAGVFGTNNFTATGNMISGFFTTGISAGNNNTITNNSITGTGLAIQASSPVTATCNWFGSSQASFIAAKVSSANVSYSPWLTNGTDADPITIGFQPLPDICNGTAVNASISSQTNISCFEGNNGAADIAISGGVLPYTFIWSKEGDAAFSQTDEDLNNATAGNYSLLITDAVGTTDTINISISEPSQLTVEVTGSNVSCFDASNGEATVNVSGGTGEYTYLWNNGSTTASITGLVAGDYLVSVTDINGCISKDSISIIQPSAVTLDLVITNVTNSGSLDGVIEVNAQGNTAPYSYSLDGSNYITNNVFNGLGAGNYTVYVKDANGCEYSTTATLTEPASQPNLKLYFPFTGNTNDASGNNINPTYTGAGLAPATDRFGQPSAAYAFDGASGSYLRVPADQLPTGDRTVSLWFRAADVSSRPVLLSYGGNSVSAPGSSYFMGLNLGGASTYQMSGHFGSNNLEHAYSSAPVNQWIHWVVTIEGSSQKSFINGQLVATGSFNFPTFVTGKDLALGVAVNTTGVAPYSDINVGYFQGSLDEVRIYDGALTEVQVLNLYTQESTPPITGDIYVNDNNTNGDVFTSAVGNDTNAGTAVAPFATIQHAVSVAPAGSTIYVDAGTYVEQVTINKGLTLTGAGRTKTLVTLPATTAPVPGTFNEQATFQTLPDIADVHINGFSITGKYIEGVEAITPVILQTGGSVRNNNLQGGNQGVFFRTESAVKTALVENCIVDAEFVGVNFSGSNLTGTLLNNEVTVHNANFSAGVFGTDNFTATGNIITGFFTTGIGAGNNNTITNNSITGLGLSIRAASPVTATCNWFGTSNGAAIASIVSPGVNFTPWLINGTDAEPATIGFHPLAGACNTAQTYYVNDNSIAGDVFTTAIGNNANLGTAAAPFATIQFAVNAVPEGSTIYVDAGTYTEQVTISRGVILQGAGVGKTIVNGPAGTLTVMPEFHETGIIQSLLNISNVTVDGITVDGTLSTEQHAVFIQGGGKVSNSELRNVNNGVYFRSVNGAPLIAESINNHIHGISYVGLLSFSDNMDLRMYNNVIDLNGAIFGMGVIVGGTGLKLTALNNQIINHNGFGFSLDASEVVIQNNSITAIAGKSIANGRADMLVNATCNWFGTTNADVIKERIQGNVVYSPWLTNGTDADSEAIGFQPLSDVCNGTAVVANINSQTNITCFAGTNGAADVNISGGVLPYSFVWSKEGDATFSQLAEDLTNVTAGTYSLLVTDAVGDTAMIKLILAQPSGLITEAVVTNVTCFGASNGSIDLVLSEDGAGSSFAWTGPKGFRATTEDISGRVTGNYSVIVTNAAGCTETRNFVITQPNPLNVIAPDTEITGCVGSGSITATATGGVAPYQYRINGGELQAGNVFSGLALGTYSVQVIDANGCVAADPSVTIADRGIDAYEDNNAITKAAPVITGATIQARLATTKGSDVDWFSFTVPASSTYSVSWNHPSVTQNFSLNTLNKNKAVLLIPVTSDAGSKTYNLSAGTTYYVQVSGAQSFVCYTLQVNAANTVSAASEMSSKKESTISTGRFEAIAYPNPHRGNVTLRVESPVYGEGQITLYDLTGRIVSVRKMQLQKGTNTIQLDKLQPGMMIYKVMVDGKIITGKLTGAE